MGWSIAVKLDKMAHTDPLHPISGKSFEFIKSKMADSRHLKNRHKLPCFNNGLTDCHDIWHDDAFWPSVSYLPLKFEYLLIQDGGWPTFWKLENRHISATGWPTATKFGVMMHIPAIDPLHHGGRVRWRHSDIQHDTISILISNMLTVYLTLYTPKLSKCKYWNKC